MSTILTKTEANYDFGEDFNYAQWATGTELTLTNVPWGGDYRDVVRFADRPALDSYIDNSPNLILNNATPQRLHNNAKVPTPYNAALKYNYLRAKNPAYGSAARTYYYFIVDVLYRSFNSTELVLQLDVWQTFGYDVHVGKAYVERGHIGIANTKQFDNYGRDYLNAPEGLDTGGEYRIVKVARETVMDTQTYWVLVCSTVNLTTNPGTAKDPVLKTATGSEVDGLVSGADFYLFPSPDDFKKFISTFSKFPWVTQGIISVTMIPNPSRYMDTSGMADVAADVVTNSVEFPGGGGVEVVGPPGFSMYRYPNKTSVSRKTALASNWRDTLLNTLPAQYRILKKLLTYPYCVVELTTWSGQALPVRPESWRDDDATVLEQAVMMPPGQRIAFMPYRYNADSATSAVSDDDAGEYLDFATTISGFPSVPVVNNMALNFLAANKNGLAFQFQSADWSQQRAYAGIQNTLQVANANIGNTRRQAGIGNAANTAQAVNNANTVNMQSLNNAMAGLVDVGMRGASGNITGAIGSTAAMTAGALNAGLSASNMMEQSAVQNRGRSQSAESSVQAAGQIRDSNTDLASFAMQGDYQNSIAGINAKIQDSRMIQPSTAGQFGGDALNLAHSNVEVSARFKLVDNSVLKIVGNFWLRYGYSIQQFIDIPADYKCMSRFTYWKMTETYITQAFIPEMFKQAIRGIFEKGVTVWSNPDYIGTTDFADNHVIEGISY